MIYYSILFLILSLSIFDIVQRHKIKYEYFGLYLAITFFLILFAGSRNDTGFDFGSYKEIFEKVTLDNFLKETTEIGFAVIIHLCKFFSIPYNVFLLIIATAAISLKSFFFFKNSPFPTLAIAVYFSLGFMYNDMGQIRHGLAIGIVLCSFNYIYKQKFFQFTSLVVLASLFHISALITIPAYWFICNLKLTDLKIVLTIIFLLPFTILNIGTLVLKTLTYLPIDAFAGKIAYYILDDQFSKPLGLNISLIIRLGILALGILTVKKTNDDKLKFWVNLYFLGIIYYMLFNSISEVAIRSSLYFKYLECIIVPSYLLLGAGYRRVLIWFPICAYLFFLVFKFITDPDITTAYLPYQSFSFNMTINLIIDCRMIHNSGIGVYIKNIIKLISEEREAPSVKYICNAHQIEDVQLLTGCSNQDIVIFKSKPFSITEQIEFMKLPASEKLWVPHINIPLFKFKCKKLIVSIHDVFHLAHKEYYGFFAIQYFKFLFTMIKVLADSVITVSNFSKWEIVKYTSIKAEKITVIYNGVNKLSSSMENPMPDHTNYILFVGNVKPHKNVRALIDAFNKISETIEDWRLVIVGKKEGFFLDEHKSVVKGGDHIVFTGSISDQKLLAYYKHCSLFVLPSLYEGFGLPILEAMCFNKPILASNIASIPEIGGDAINYFDPNLAGDLENRLRGLLTDKIPLHISYDSVLSRFTWEKSSIQHLKVILST